MFEEKLECENRLKSKVVSIIEKGQDIQILIPIPEQYYYDENILGLSVTEIYKKILQLMPGIDEFANSAFLKHDKESWNAIQTLLYYWNYRDITRIDRLKNSVLLEYAFRKKILEIQNQNLPKYQLDCIKNFTPEIAVKELADKASNHRINKHPFLKEMDQNGISVKHTRLFLENYYVNNRIFHLFIASLSLCTPFNERGDLACNFYDEMGQGDSALAHPNLFLKNFNGIGRPKAITPLPEALSLANAKAYAAFLSGDYHYGLGGFGFIELTMPNQMKKILNGLEKSGIPRADLEFWEAHITIDVEHGKTWFSNMLSLIKTEQDAQKCLQGGMFLLDARATMYDGIMSC